MTAPETLQQIVAEIMDAAQLLASFRFFTCSREKAKQPEGTDLFDQQIERLRKTATRLERLSASEATGGEVKPMKLLGYANASRIRMTCASKPGGAHLGQVAIYAGESVDPMESQGLENLMWKEDRL